MKARLVRIGNSRGIRLPKPLIEQAGLVDEVELRMQRAYDHHTRGDEGARRLGRSRSADAFSQ